MTLTTNNHFHPCFWTAFWNLQYLQSLRNGNKEKGRARDREVWCLNLLGDKIYRTSVNKVFYTMKAGLAKFNKELALEFAQREFPDKISEIEGFFDKYPHQKLMNFEPVYSGFENLLKFFIEKVISKCEVDEISKALLSSFITFQYLRNPQVLVPLEKKFQQMGLNKFEIFLHVGHFFSDGLAQMNHTGRIAFSPWTMFKMERPIFPLSDAPVLKGSKYHLFPLAPDLLLKLDIPKAKIGNPNYSGCSIRKEVPASLYQEFKRKTLNSSSTQIIHSDRALLEKWKKSKTYADRLQQIHNRK